MGDDRAADRPAILGGPRTRTERMPTRRAFGPAEEARVREVIEHYRGIDADPGYEGRFERSYCAAFERFMGGGHADAVATGTAALYVALAALDLRPGAEVITAPITDPGGVAAITLQGFRPVLADTRPGRYTMGPEEIAARITPRTAAVIVVHCTGEPAEIDAIATLCRDRGIRLVEDCSQAHGARCRGRPVGSFGDIAAFSTMYRKAHASGGSGGIVYTRDLTLHRRALAHADRGKPRWRSDFDDRSPAGYLFPALNWNTDEFSCAIGTASLARLPETIARRLAYVDAVADGLRRQSSVCRPYGHTADFSPFIYPVFVDEQQISCSKQEFAEAVRAEGIDLNPHYGYLLWEWPWLRPYLSDGFATPNARDARDRSFCLYLNERYTAREAADTLAAIAKVERWMTR